MSLVTRIRTLTFSTLTALVLAVPGCDDGAAYEALGVTAQDLEAMSAEELDALDAELDALAVDGAQPVTHTPHARPEGMKELMIPLPATHAERPHGRKLLKAPGHPTHEGGFPAPATDALAGEPDGATPCTTHGDDTEFAAG